MAKVPKSEVIYDYLKERIASGYFVPGQRIVASHIAEEVGTSVLPVREALFALEAEQLVSITPYVGAVVSWVSKTEMIAVMEMLALCEGYATAQAYRRGNDFVEDLSSINTELKGAAENQDWPSFIALNREFHFSIYQGSGNEVLIKNIQVFWSQLDVMLDLTKFHLVTNRANEDVAEHETLINFLGRPNTDLNLLEHLAREHRLRTVEYLKRAPDGTKDQDSDGQLHKISAR